MAERNVIGQNGTLTLTLCLTIIPTLTLTIFLNLTQPYPNQPTNQPSTGQSQCVPPFRSGNYIFTKHMDITAPNLHVS